MLNPSEISDILKQQLENVSSQVKFEEVGTVLSVGDGVARLRPGKREGQRARGV